jgi:hypothetical protein
MYVDYISGKSIQHFEEESKNPVGSAQTLRDRHKDLWEGIEAYCICFLASVLKGQCHQNCVRVRSKDIYQR